MIVKTKDGINIKKLDFIYYIDMQTYEIIKIDLNLEKSKSINYKFHEIGKYLSYPTTIRACTKYLLQFLNNPSISLMSLTFDKSIEFIFFNSKAYS